MATYKVIRHFRDNPEGNTVIRTGLTLAEAQSHCRDKETSSSTATSEWAKRETEMYGPWFDGYTKEGRDKNE